MAYRITVLLYYCTTVLLYYRITVLPYYCTTVLQYGRITVLPYYCTTVLPYYRITVLPYYCTTVLRYYRITVLPYYCTTVLLCYRITVLPHYCTYEQESGPFRANWRCKCPPDDFALFQNEQLQGLFSRPPRSVSQTQTIGSCPKPPMFDQQSSKRLLLELTVLARLKRQVCS